MCFFTLVVFSHKANHSIRKEMELQPEVSCLKTTKLTPVIVGAGAEDINIVAVFPFYTLDTIEAVEVVFKISKISLSCFKM